MSRKIIVTFDKSTNEDAPVLVVAQENLGMLRSGMDVINTITGDEAVEIYNKLVGSARAIRGHKSTELHIVDKNE